MSGVNDSCVVTGIVVSDRICSNAGSHLESK